MYNTNSVADQITESVQTIRDLIEADFPVKPKVTGLNISFQSDGSIVATVRSVQRVFIGAHRRAE